MLWSDLKAQIRRLLVDPFPTVSGTPRWSDQQLLDFIAWSLDALCSHTAIASASGFTCDGTNTVFTVPDNAYERIDLSGAVYVDDGAGGLSYLNPVRYNMRSLAMKGYYLQPDNTIHLIQTPTSASTLTVEYFAYYPHPIQDSDLVLTPSWATPALCYRVAAHAMSPLGGKSANIRQWGQKPDTGNPEDNSLQHQSEWYFQLYEQELLKAPRQERQSFYRSTT